MNYLYEALEKPTRLYIKQCPHCGLKYFGKTISKDIEKYPGSGKVWKRHLKKHKVIPVHLWSSDWYYDTSIKRFALKFSRINKIIESKTWANIKDEDGLDGGDAGGYLSSLRTDPAWKETVGRKAFEKMQRTINSSEWKETVGKEKAKKISDIQTDNEWKNTVGREKSQKVKETVNALEWKETIGKEKAKKISKTKNSDEWKNTIGEERSKKMKMLYQDNTWLETTGKNTSDKISAIRNDESWIQRNSKTCKYCNKTMQVSNYSRWHGEKCKEKS